MLVWAVTHADLDAFEAVLDGRAPHEPGWVSTSVLEKVHGYGTQLCRAGDVPASAVVGDPLSVLTAYLVAPAPERWSTAARCVAFALAASGQADPASVSAASVPAALPILARTAMDGHTPTLPVGSAQLLGVRTPSGAVLAVEPRGVGAVQAVLAVDDRDGVVGSTGYRETWRDWLALGNILQLLEPGSFTSLGRGLLPTEVSRVETITISVTWQQLVDAFDGAMARLARRLAEAGIAEPEAGLELADGEYVIDLAWPAVRVAVVQDADDERDRWLRAEKWTVLPPDEHRVLAALNAVEAVS